MGQRKKQARRSPAPEPLALLDDLIRLGFAPLQDEMRSRPSLNAWLKLLEVRMKLAPTEQSQAELWQLLEEIRAAELEENGSHQPPVEN